MPLGLFQLDPEIQARRERLARQMARAELPGLLEFAGQPEPGPSEVEDGLCARLGEIMHRYEAGDAHDGDRNHERAWLEYLEPDRVLGAVAFATIEALGAPGEVPRAADFEPGGALFGPWRLWEVLREIAPAEAQALSGLENTLRSGFPDAPLPESTTRSLVPDSLRWVCDGYGSRFLITAAFERAGQRRWYAWDVDGCGYQVVTVAAGFFDSPDAAFEEWRAAVGEDAAGPDVLVPAQDDARRRLITELLPFVEGYGRMGGESAVQMGDYHRSRRLAQLLRAAPEMARAAVDFDRAEPDLGQDAPDFGQAGPAPKGESRPELMRQRGARFAEWLTAREPEHVSSYTVEELASELADSWAGAAPKELFLTCSPHRVAAKIRALRDFYLGDFAAELEPLLPHWLRWIAEQTQLPDHLLTRSLEYCDGRVHPAQSPDERDPDWYARCAE